MQNTANIFHEIASKVSDSHTLHEILHKQQHTFDIQPYKFQGCCGENLLKNYQNLSNKYSQANNNEQDPNNWNQNQRRLFVWFIVCYTYFLQREEKTLNTDIWNELSSVFFQKRPQFLHFQYLNLLKNRKRVTWSSDEDQLLTRATQKLQPGKWNSISRQIFYQSNREIFRTPKHCRQRWLNHLDENKKHGEWTHKQDLSILEYTLSKGKKWSRIVEELDGTRTEHMIKNRYNSLISKWRSGKKQKQEEVAKKIYSMLLQNSQSNKQSEINNQLEVITEKQDQKIKKEVTDPLPIQIQATSPKDSSQPTVPLAVPQTYPYNCLLNYNQYLWFNEYFYRNSFPWMTVDPRNQHIFPVSNQSSFSSFRRQEQGQKCFRQP